MNVICYVSYVMPIFCSNKVNSSVDVIAFIAFFISISALYVNKLLLDPFLFKHLKRTLGQNSCNRLYYAIKSHFIIVHSPPPSSSQQTNSNSYKWYKFKLTVH